jgi:hypothetical protein
VVRASGICLEGPRFNPWSGRLFCLTLSLFMNRDLRVGVYDKIIIKIKYMHQNHILSIGDHFLAIDLRTGAIEK